MSDYWRKWSSLPTHNTNAHTKAPTAVVKSAVDIDLSNLATKTDLAELRCEMADIKAELIKWVIGVGFAQVATILAVPKPFPSAHP